MAVNTLSAKFGQRGNKARTQVNRAEASFLPVVEANTEFYLGDGAAPEVPNAASSGRRDRWGVRGSRGSRGRGIRGGCWCGSGWSSNNGAKGGTLVVQRLHSSEVGRNPKASVKSVSHNTGLRRLSGISSSPSGSTGGTSCLVSATGVNQRVANKLHDNVWILGRAVVETRCRNHKFGEAERHQLGDVLKSTGRKLVSRLLSKPAANSI